MRPKAGPKAQAATPVAHFLEESSPPREPAWSFDSQNNDEFIKQLTAQESSASLPQQQQLERNSMNSMQKFTTTEESIMASPTHDNARTSPNTNQDPHASVKSNLTLPECTTPITTPAPTSLPSPTPPTPPPTTPTSPTTPDSPADTFVKPNAPTTTPKTAHTITTGLLTIDEVQSSLDTSILLSSDVEKTTKIMNPLEALNRAVAASLGEITPRKRSKPSSNSTSNAMLVSPSDTPQTPTKDRKKKLDMKEVLDRVSSSLTVHKTLKENPHKRNITVYVATWNMGNAAPLAGDWSGWLPINQDINLYDIIVVGVQECNYKIDKQNRNSWRASRRSFKQSMMEIDANPDMQPRPQPQLHNTFGAHSTSPNGSPKQTFFKRFLNQRKQKANNGTAQNPTNDNTNNRILSAAEMALQEELQQQQQQQQQQQIKTRGRVDSGSGMALWSRAGLQEYWLKKKARRKVVSRDPFDSQIQMQCGLNYRKIASVHLMDMRMIALASTTVFPFISDIQKGKKATGFGGVLGNKGGLMLKFNLFHRSLCFLSCHLTPHEGERNVKFRNQDMHDILRATSQATRHKLDVSAAFDCTFILGDLNYRTDMKIAGRPEVNQLTPEQHSAFVQDAAKAGKYAEIYAGDQLRREMAANHVLSGFSELPPTFPPTYKVLRNQLLSYELARTPSYCDRILWNSHPGLKKRITQIDTQSVCGVMSSDHKPVLSVFKIPIPTAVPRTLRESYVLSISSAAFTELLRPTDVTRKSKHAIRLQSPALAKERVTIVWRQHGANQERADGFEWTDIPSLTLRFKNFDSPSEAFLIVSVWARERRKGGWVLVCHTAIALEPLLSSDNKTQIHQPAIRFGMLVGFATLSLRIHQFPRSNSPVPSRFWHSHSSHSLDGKPGVVERGLSSYTQVFGRRGTRHVASQGSLITNNSNGNGLENSSSSLLNASNHGTNRGGRQNVSTSSLANSVNVE